MSNRLVCAFFFLSSSLSSAEFQLSPLVLILSPGGESLRLLLSKTTQHCALSFIFGLLLTAVTQSISVTSVLILSLIEGEMMNLLEAFQVLLGAGIGATLIGHLVAFQVVFLPSSHFFLPFCD